MEPFPVFVLSFFFLYLKRLKGQEAKFTLTRLLQEQAANQGQKFHQQHLTLKQEASPRNRTGRFILTLSLESWLKINRFFV